MAKFIIRGGKRLAGSITVAGSKNAVLPMLAATLLTDQECVLTNVPRILDVENFLKIITGLGGESTQDGSRVRISCRGVGAAEPNDQLVSSMRASIVLAGALLGLRGRVELAYPGGDLIGARPIDLHLRAFRSMGVAVRKRGRKILLSTNKPLGATVYADSSVTGTENIVLAAVRATGTTVIKLSALEPHVTSLCLFLNQMGARIAGIGSHTLTVRGVRRLHGAKTRVIPDMIEAGSFAILAAATGSEIRIQQVAHDVMDAAYGKLEEMGVRFETQGSSLLIRKPLHPYRAAVIRTGLYPGLATDLQPPFGVLATQARGTSIIHDWIFEGRLGYLKELQHLGARAIIVDSHHAEIHGPTKLHGGSIHSLDIRSGMTLVIAALVARGRSVLNDIYHINRGYERIDERLRQLGADIQRVG